MPSTPPTRPRLGRRASSALPLAAQPPRPVLAVARTNGGPGAPTVALRTDLPWPPADVCWRVYGVVGTYVLRRATYLVLAAGAKAVGELHGHPVYALTRVVCVPLTAAAAATGPAPPSPMPDDGSDPAAAVLDATCRRDYTDPTSAAAVAAAAAASGSRSRTTLALQRMMLGTLDKAARTWRGVRGGGDSLSGDESGSQGDRLRGSELALPPADRGARGSGTSTPDPAVLAAQRDADADARTLRALAQYFEGGDFFFSYAYDLTNCLQRQPRGAGALATPLRTSCGSALGAMVMGTEQERAVSVCLCACVCFFRSFSLVHLLSVLLFLCLYRLPSFSLYCSGATGPPFLVECACIECVCGPARAALIHAPCHSRLCRHLGTPTHIYTYAHEGQWAVPCVRSRGPPCLWRFCLIDTTSVAGRGP
jgi:hypothetical protein